MSEPVRSEIVDAVGVVTLDNPPVNALSLALRTGVRDAVTRFIEDDAVEAIVLTGGGKMFSGGADITEFDSGVSNQSPALPELIELVENSPKPVVAAVHGTAVGGGLELPLGCHARVAAAGSQVGLPEVTLGLVPGAGGTQRLPRLVGPAAALDAIVSGKFLGAEKAHALGLVDRVVEAGGSVVDVAVALAKELAGGGPPVKTRERDDKLSEGVAEGLFDQARKDAARRRRGFEAPQACIDCVEAAVTKTFEEGLAFERDTFQRLRTSDQSKAQRHAFFAEREARKGKGVGRDTKELTITRGAILGCGTMGGGIAMSFANAGIPVVVTETQQDALDRGMATIRKNYESTVSKGRMSADDAEARIALIEPTLDFERVADADIVIEAVFENMDLKKDIFTRLDALCRPDAIMATNTSSLDLAGVDVGYKVRQHRPRPEGVRYSGIADKLYHMDRYGQKTGKGWYRYEPGNRTPIPDPEVTELILETSKELGIERREISDEEILQRCLYPLVNEGARILEEGIAQRSSDLDVIWLHGYGFPRYRGGPMFWADSLGVGHVY
ncbi:MAG: enoyl-CoA hydratase-related protein, partial [Gemmatimonadota bacterium]